MGILKKNKIFNFFLELISLGTPRAIILVISFFLTLLLFLPFNQLGYFPVKSLNKYIGPLIFGKFITCPTEGFLEHCCVSCGLTRASSMFLHGNFSIAYYYNPLVFIVIPLVIFLLILNSYKLLKKN